jgi:hypothetical protein
MVEIPIYRGWNWFRSAKISKSGERLMLAMLGDAS